MIASVLIAAALASQLADCRGITDDARRLACYDALSPAPPAAPAPEASFGHDSLPKPETKEPDRVETHVIGKINGWRRGTKFTLDNGQVWQSIDDHESDETLDQPAVTIKRNFVGHYWMKLGGASQDVLVTRIQ